MLPLQAVPWALLEPGTPHGVAGAGVARSAAVGRRARGDAEGDDGGAVGEVDGRNRLDPREEAATV